MAYSDDEIRELFDEEAGRLQPGEHKTPTADGLNAALFAGRLPKRYRALRFPPNIGPSGQQERDDDSET